MDRKEGEMESQRTVSCVQGTELRFSGSEGLPWVRKTKLQKDQGLAEGGVRFLGYYAGGGGAADLSGGSYQMTLEADSK